jgi:hypothetical protein
MVREDIFGMKRGFNLPPGHNGPSDRNLRRLGVFVFATLLIGGAAIGVNLAYLQFDALMKNFPNRSPFVPYYFGITGVCIAFFMYFIKRNFLYQYAWAEIGFAFGCMMVAWRQYYDNQGTTAALTLVGAIYVAVRGLENRAKALEPPKEEI